LRDREEALKRDLDQWFCSLTLEKQSNGSSTETLQASFGRIRSTALQFFYHYGTCAIYRRFILWNIYKPNPAWNNLEAQQGQQVDALRRKEKTTKCAMAARAMIFLLSRLDIKAQVPSW
jgi:hypothetical protein